MSNSVIFKVESKALDQAKAYVSKNYNRVTIKSSSSTIVRKNDNQSVKIVARAK